MGEKVTRGQDIIAESTASRAIVGGAGQAE
jgi:hypothetical protein